MREFRECDDSGDEEDIKLHEKRLIPEETEVEISERYLTPEEVEDIVQKYKASFLTPEECDRIIKEYNEEQGCTKDGSEEAEEELTGRKRKAYERMREEPVKLQDGERKPSDESKIEIEDASKTTSLKEDNQVSRKEVTEYRPTLIESKETFDNTVEKHQDLRFKRDYDTQYRQMENYYEKEMEEHPPKIVEEMEKLESYRLYKEEHGRLPEVQLSSMKDVDGLLEKHQITVKQEEYERCRKFFAVQQDWTITQKELAEIHGIPERTAGRYRAGGEPALISHLRRKVESEIIKNWVHQNSSRLKQMDSIIDPSDPLSKKNSRLQPIENSSMHDTFSNIERDNIAQAVIDTILNLPEKHGEIYYADLKSILGLDSIRMKDMEKNFESYREAIESALEKIGEEKETRFAFVDGRFYVWKPNLNPNHLINAYRNSQFHFKSKHELAKVISDIKSALNHTNSLGLHDTVQYLERMLDQFFGSEEGKPHISISKARIDAQKFQVVMDLTGHSLKQFEGKIGRITGMKSQGGIVSPRFPDGQELEVARARFVASIISDGSIRKDGRIRYTEGNPDRLKILESNMQVWGDIRLNRYYREDKGVYECSISNVLGNALGNWGVKFGDKAISNTGLPNIMKNDSTSARNAYLEELIPEDGWFQRGRFGWSRTVVLDAGDKSKQYGFKTKLTPQEIDYIKRKSRRTERSSVRHMTWNDLTRAGSSIGESDSKTAKSIASKIMANRSNLIDDEADIARKLGIFIRIRPDEIRYSERSGRISVQWKARTKTVQDAISWAKTCPPNDVRKRKKVEKWLSERADVSKYDDDMTKRKPF